MWLPVGAAEGHGGSLTGGAGVWVTSLGDQGLLVVDVGYRRNGSWGNM